jgi:pimeloyl-ACP methyl ester carboxylesterase
MKKTRIPLADIQGYTRLITDAVVGITNVVETMHQTILRLPPPMEQPGKRKVRRVPGVAYRVLRGSSKLVYQSIRGVTKGIGGSLDLVLSRLQPELMTLDSSPTREAVLAILNGVLGDHMQARGNPLLTDIGFRMDGRMLVLSKEALAADIPNPGPKVLVLLHGHCMNEMQWERNGHHHGETLASNSGFTPIYLRYNTGLHISQNGRALSELLEQLVCNWPVPVAELCILGFSMGGMLARSAFHYAAQTNCTWPHKVRKLLFVGTPHHGSMLEQAGNIVDKTLEFSPYSQALSRIGKIRSAGTTDLRHGNLIDEDWKGHNRFAHFSDQRQVSQLPKHVQCYAIAAMLAKEYNQVSGELIGDGLVPLASALGRHKDPRRALNFPTGQQRVFYGIGHLGLLGSRAVCEQLQDWILAPDSGQNKE